MTKAVLLPLGFLLLLAVALPAQSNSPADMAINRAVMDQANTILLRQKLEDAKGAAARGDLPGAAKFYEDAKLLVDQIGSGIDAETAQTISGLVATRLELARQAQKNGDFLEANTQVTRALRVDPHNPAAIKFKLENDQTMAALKGRMPDTATLEQIPAINNDKTQAGTLVQDGKLLYEMGKFEEAADKLNQALKLDPDNQGAFYYLSLVKQADYAREEHNRTTEGQNSMVQVSKAWSPKVGIGLPVPNPYVTNTDVHTGVGREVIYRKLNTIQLDSVSWDGLPLSEVIHYLTEQSRLRDPDKKGINFIFNPNVEAGSVPSGTGVGPGAPVALNATTGLPQTPEAAGTEPADASAITVQLALNDVSLHDALDAIALVAHPSIKYSVEDYAVVISAKPSGPEPPTLEMRVFKVDPNTFYDGLQGVSTINFGSANNSSSSGGTTGGTSGGTSGGNSGGNSGGSSGGNGSSISGANVPVVLIPSGGGAGGGGGVGGGGGGRGGGGGGGGGAAGGAAGAAGANSGVGGLSYINPTSTQMQDVSTAVQNFFNSIGVNLTATAPGRSVTFNDRLGLLFVKATPGELDTIERAIQALNQIAPQVHIKTRFIEINQDDNSALGFDWYLGNFINGKVVANGGSAPSLTVPVSTANPLGAFPGNTAANLIAGSATDQQITSGLRNTGPAIATVTGILTDPNFRVVLHALEQRTGVESLAEPEAVTTSGRQTQMRATDIEYILTGFGFDTGTGTTGVGATTATTGTTVQATPNSAITPTTQQFEIGPTLDVVPYVLSDGYTVNLTLIPQVLEFLQYDPVPTVPGYTPSVATSSGGVSTLPTVLPHFTVREIVTSVNIWDNQTVVLGGLISSEINTTKDKVPFLGDLPLLGRLFQSQSKTSNKKNLMIFVTATIVDPAGNRVHSDDELPFNPVTIPAQPAVEGQTFQTNSAATSAAITPPPQ
jgi:type II secretory pathway component GspD/PulD (secretin)/Tfp pilus assembly protein PilF